MDLRKVILGVGDKGGRGVHGKVLLQCACEFWASRCGC